MEYVENGSLTSVLGRVRSGSPPRFWNPTGIGIIISGIVLGMGFVHSQGFIHRDLKPSSILINERGEALIADFGTSRSEYDDGTMTSETGSAHYAAPEMYREDSCFSNKVDVFSFGLILYEILIGRPVFRSSMMSFPIMRKVLTGDVPSIPDHIGKVTQSLISRCWSLKPECRPSFNDILNEVRTCDFALGLHSPSLFNTHGTFLIGKWLIPGARRH
jgi:serine/threonine protein kinase